MPSSAYSYLAPIYDDAGFAHYSSTMTPILLTHIQQTGWVGRRILDLGCGTGASTAFFASNNLDVLGIDFNDEMLRTAHMRVDGTGYLARLLEADIRQADYPDELDLVFMIGNVLNELSSPREVELIFQKASQALRPGKRFVFDMFTLQGIAHHLGTAEQVLDVSNRFFMTTQNTFSYENMTLRQNFNIFTLTVSENWQRTSSYLTLRSWPQQLIISLLEKAGLEVMGIYTSSLRPFDVQNDYDGRAIFIAKKPNPNGDDE